MHRFIRKHQRKLLVITGMGTMLQTGSCVTNDPQLQAVISSVVQPVTDLLTRQVANIAADTLFFLLDNFLVRLTT